MRRSPLATLFLTVTLDLIGFGMVVPLMPLYAERLAVSGHAIAWLLSSYSLMQFFFAPVWGRLSDRVGRRPVLLVSIFINAVCLLGFALADHYWMLLATRIGAGICTANISVASAYVADVTTDKGRARGMGAIGAAFGLGFVLGPFLAGELSPYGLMVPALTAAALSAVNGVLAIVLLPESLPKERRASAHGRTSWYQERWGTLLTQPATWPLYVLVFLQVAGFAMMEMALALYCEHQHGMDAAATGRLLAFVGLVMVFVQGGLVGPLVKRVGERRLVRWALLGLGLSLATIPLLAQAGLGLGGLFVGLGMLAATQGLATPSLSGLISRSAPGDAQGAAMGLSQSSSALARTIGPALAGLLLDAYGVASPFYGASAVLGVAVLLAIARLGGTPHAALS